MALALDQQGNQHVQSLATTFRRLLADQEDGWRLWLGLWTNRQTNVMLTETRILHILPLLDRRALTVALERLTGVMAQGARTLWKKREQAAHDQKNFETVQREQR